MSEILIKDDVTRYGLGRIHVVSNQIIDQAAWMFTICERQGYVESKLAYHQDGTYHFWLFWRASK